MPVIIPRLKNFNWSKVPPLLELSQNDLMNGLRHPHEKNKFMYKNCLNLGPEFQVNESMKEWLIHGHVIIHEVTISCNNSYRTGNNAEPFETLYEQECQSPVCWTKVGVVELLAPTLNRETTKKIIRICNKVQAAHNHYHSYTDVRILFDKRGKLNPCYIEPFKISAKVANVAYRLELSNQLSRVHGTFHESNLKKCLSDETLAIPLDEIPIDDELHLIEKPVEIMDRENRLETASQITRDAVTISTTTASQDPTMPSERTTHPII
ncbi:hypothetical protein Tco_1523972 [Tanacetum coccineum]